ncbi:hypothetical protein MA16_Dca012994 [Dendrobium catenatum]|uniref:Uncharacterized protein n=1 Tax=Dendrobium catenatum TaxID=906689 RepID=A0A2I0VUQ7_9ASPA|nr:hypothetical protein MA16_Dca012994 [Dendrobium catenatum]
MLSAHSPFLGGTPTPTRRTTPTPRRHRSLSIASSSPPSDPLTTFGRLLWGRSLPPTPLISLARSSWSSAWHLMMLQLAPSTPSGSYSRPSSPFPSAPAHYLTSRPLRLTSTPPSPSLGHHDPSRSAPPIPSNRSSRSPTSSPQRRMYGNLNAPDFTPADRTLRDVYGFGRRV